MIHDELDESIDPLIDDELLEDEPLLNLELDPLEEPLLGKHRKNLDEDTNEDSEGYEAEDEGYNPFEDYTKEDY